MSVFRTAKTIISEIQEISTKISRDVKRNKMAISLDMLWCLLKYSASPNNYDKFEFYNLNAHQRNTYVTYGISKKMIKKFNDQNDIDFFENKLKFAQSFNDEFKRGYLNVSDMNFEEFSDFVAGNDKFICKPIGGSQGSNIRVFHIDRDIQIIYEEIKKDFGDGYMIEEWIAQHKVLSDVYPNAVNCLRIITVYDGFKVHYLTGGVTFSLDSEIANGSQPSIVAPVNFETGIIDKPATTFGSELYEKHPKTNVQILGLQLPYWDEIKAMLENACRKVATVRYIGWDIAITPDGPVLIEGNTTPGYKYYQIPKHMENGIGNKEKYVRYL